MDAVNGSHRKWMLGMDDSVGGCLVWKTEEVDAGNGRLRKWVLVNRYGRQSK